MFCLCWWCTFFNFAAGGGLQLVNVPQVMALVAILHLVEAFLIYFTGSMNVLPIYVSTKEGGTS